MTPKGTPLEGNFPKSVCLFHLDVAPMSALETALLSLAEHLQAPAIARSGVNVEIIIGVFSADDTAFSIPPALLHAASSAGARIDIFVYPNRDE
ncbi:hypothetical protein [Hyphomicrobium sp. D-2]|uniref:hypothetical protein n=1 Tax=Hyphomicrobium sp. D-2 TaxID=3041621 RepID=UPI002457A808|nr:hypothetical protein [Hyphomicrobium sp. D-2]MDH4981165.1 hypothetical protein [Hyphomicrobium sp. D-2]